MMGSLSRVTSPSLIRMDISPSLQVQGFGHFGRYNVYPKEVESEIDDLDGVNESAVIGVPPRFWRGGRGGCRAQIRCTLKPSNHFAIATAIGKIQMPKNGFLC